ncbi:hypothetical protein L6452_17660 [Arctium lappa]|uniref:Uncharacterized protein n=1 Tax=Arctium lappa TaxID=4217 RepID=A0ACB9C405_ARCLA|nr:hypothetical protein L6452_17660 [Arctium lappa]
MTHARPLCRNVKLGDSLKFPYVVRILDFNVSGEDKRAYEWALSIFGRKVDPLLRMRVVDEKTQYGIFRGNLEEAARHWPNLMKMKGIDLQRMVIKHLITVDHAAAKDMKGVVQERATMIWQMQHNGYDSGVFTMRHTETFMGDMNLWKTGYSEEGQRQQTQLEDLKKKYVAKIALHDQNLVKTAMKKEIERFTSMDPDIKLHILGQAYETRFERLEF